MSDLIYSSAVLTLSQTTEFMRNKSIDNIIINLIVGQRLTSFSVSSAYEKINHDLPIRIEEIQKSFIRSFEAGVLTIEKGCIENANSAIFKISENIKGKITEQVESLNKYFDESIDELFKGIVDSTNRERLKELLLDVLTKLMAKYGYAYAGQLAGIGNATEFVPNRELKAISIEALKNSSIQINPDILIDCIEILFDRRDPCLNNLAFSICNRYYMSRLIGLDLPIDFITQNLYKDSVIYLDTNFIMRIAFSKSQRHNEFREILKKAPELGIRFVTSELTVAEIHAKVSQYEGELSKAEESLPEDLIIEVREEILESNQAEKTTGTFVLRESENTTRLENMGIEIIPFDDEKKIFTRDEIKEMKAELSFFDRKYRSKWDPKNDAALFHDAYLYYIVKEIREKNSPNSSWFLTMDNSVIEHGISKKKENEPPYSIRLLSILQTLSQFVESHALKGEFADMFGELVSKDLLPRDQLFSFSDLKLLIGFDIKAKDIPPEFIRKATLHIKNQVLKGGELNEKNRAEVIQEFHKYLATPEQNFIELQKKFDKKLRDRDEDIKIKEQKINEYEGLVKDKDNAIDALNSRITDLEQKNKDDKLKFAIDKYEEKKDKFIDTAISNYLKNHKGLRTRYIVFIILAFTGFVLLFFINEIGSIMSLTIELNSTLKLILSLIVFLAPFIRSFFEHKKVITGFMLWNKKFKTKRIELLEKEVAFDYERLNKRPNIEDFE